MVARPDDGGDERADLRGLPAACEKISKSRTGGSLSAATKAKIGASSKGRLHTPEARAKIAEAARSRSPEHVAKIMENLRQGHNLSQTELAKRKAIAKQKKAASPAVSGMV